MTATRFWSWITARSWSGTHDELLAKQGKYYELWNLQQGIFRRKKEEPKPIAHAAVVEEDDDGGEAITY